MALLLLKLFNQSSFMNSNETSALIIKNNSKGKQNLVNK